MSEQKIAPVLSDDEIDHVQTEYMRNYIGTPRGFARMIEQAVLARVAAGAWQPIDTAPKDGTSIIVADIADGQVFDVSHGHFEVVTEDEEDGPWDIRGGEPWCSYVGRAAGTYFCNWLPGKEFESRWNIDSSFPYTHWMLCPAPPAIIPTVVKP